MNNNDEKQQLESSTNESKSKNETFKANNNYIKFFESEKNIRRKPEILNEDFENKWIRSNYILKIIEEAFELYKKYLLNKYEKVEDYPLYKLVKENWEKEKPEIEQESYYDDFKNEKKSENLNIIKTKSPCIDGLFYLYLKEFSEKTNRNYFTFMIKFIILFRENINKQKKGIVIDDIITKDKKEFTQLYNGVEISELCNDFMEFMDINKYFELDREEIIELVQHFCYWLYDNRYSESHLILIN